MGPISQQPDSGGLEKTLPGDPTVADDASYGATPCEGDLSSLNRPRVVSLIEGTGPQLSGETSRLLLRRVRAASLLLFIALAVALVLHAIRTDFNDSLSVSVLIMHAVIVGILGIITVVLYLRELNSSAVIRSIELTVFGIPMAFFLWSEYYLTAACCDQGHFEFLSGRWLLLMFVYALFIPNTWRRAALVLGTMAFAPILFLVVMASMDAQLATLIDTTVWMRITLINVIAFASSVWGVHVIGSLRREVFEARQLGQYRLKQRIGAGGMGEVFLAEHQMMKRACVIKLIRPERAGDPRSLARFQREVRATAKLSHWNTIDIFDYGSTEEGIFYYVMEYLPGLSLAELVARHGPMPPARVIHFLRQACDALSEAHDAGLIHRDIKPANIFAARRGGVYDVAKLLDFGLVKGPTDDETSVQLTADGAITGSPLFMSPEQAIGESEPDCRSDLYSLGAVGYYLLTGTPPFQGDKPLRVMFAHAHDPVEPLSSRGVEVPADLEQVIMRCLEKKPADRFQDAETMAAALSSCHDANTWTRQQAVQWWQADKVTQKHG